MDVLSDVVTIARSDRPHVGRYVWDAPIGQRFPQSPAAVFQVLLQGACWLVASDREPARLAPGDVVFLPRGTTHALTDDPSCPLEDVPAAVLERASSGPRSVQGATAGDANGLDGGPTDGGGTVVILGGAYLLDRSAPHPLLDELPDVIHLGAQDGGHPTLRATVDLLATELGRPPRPGADGVVRTLLDLLLLSMLRAWLDDQHDAGQASGWWAALNDPAVAAALRAIHGAPAHPWTVEALGHEAHLSRAAFSRRFTAAVGRPPLSYLTWWRLTLAAQLLRSSDAPVAAVARHVGYASVHAFAHAFKRQFGTPPGAYRRSGPKSSRVWAPSSCGGADHDDP